MTGPRPLKALEVSHRAGVRVRSRRARPLASLAVWLAVAYGAVAQPSRPRLALQPFDGFDLELIPELVRTIEQLYAVQVEVLAPQDLPGTAYYPPRSRYRADRLLDGLAAECPERFAKIVGLSARDISTTKGRTQDWGIFGLADLGGRACVVSTWRLGRGKVEESRFLERLHKVVRHEVGHTLGLDHCVARHCLMQDAGGAIETVDRQRNDLCDSCRGALGALAQSASGGPDR
jgi:archaemetzincin